MSKKRWTAARKAEVVLNSLKGEKTVVELCRENGISQSTFFNWKNSFLTAASEGLKNGSCTSREAELKRQLTAAEKKIGQLVLEKEVLEFAADYIKKKRSSR